MEEVRNSGSVMKKESSEPPFKRPRIETSSPLPTFKVLLYKFHQISLLVGPSSFFLPSASDRLIKELDNNLQQFLSGSEREARGPNHCAPAIGFTFRKGEFLDFSSIFFSF